MRLAKASLAGIVDGIEILPNQVLQSLLVVENAHSWLIQNVPSTGSAETVTPVAPARAAA